VTGRVSLAPQARLPILHKTLGLWLAIFCGPRERRISRRHCPVCEDTGMVEASALGRGPIGSVLCTVDCPACESTAGLHSLLPRDAGSEQ
jgi:hypothetical protein